LLAVFGANTLVGYWRMDAELRDLVGQQQQLLKTHLPEVTPGAHPKDQLVKALSANRSLDQDAGFLNLLHEYAELNSSVRGLTTSKILFQQSRLVVNVESQDLRSLDALREKLASSRFPASVENVNIKPEQTTARVILGAEK
jgi:type II secretory pathway component PulL